jgi:hypothetical protein
VGITAGQRDSQRPIASMGRWKPAGSFDPASPLPFNNRHVAAGSR